MLTKRDLGIGYLLGTGMGLIVSLLGYLVLAGPPHLNTLLAIGTAAILSGSLIYTGVWLYGSQLGGDLVWRVAQYSSVGLSVPVAVGVLLRELRREHRTATELNERNRVLNRVLRHNLRNDMSVILGYAGMLREVADGESAEEAYETIEQRVNELIALSESARQIEGIEGEATGGPVDLAALVEERVELYRTAHERADFEVELPEEAWADVGALCTSAVDNLIENAIQHTDGDPRVRVAVGAPRNDDDVVEVVVADDGNGIPEEELRALDRSPESPLHHGSGLGLWLVKWVTESYGGEVRFDESEDGGSVVTLTFPAATTVERLIGGP